MIGNNNPRRDLVLNSIWQRTKSANTALGRADFAVPPSLMPTEQKQIQLSPQVQYRRSKRKKVADLRNLKRITQSLNGIIVAWRFDLNDDHYRADQHFYRRPTFTIHPSKLRAFALFLRNSTYCRAGILTEIAAADRLRSGGARFAVQYLFLSDLYRRRFSIELFATETEALPSLTVPFTARPRLLFASSGWLEREVWDMFGIHFTGHSDLRRILTDYGFAGHPLRKDFPLTGFTEVVYDDSLARIRTDAVELAQEFRVFHL